MNNDMHPADHNGENPGRAGRGVAATRVSGQRPATLAARCLILGLALAAASCGQRQPPAEIIGQNQGKIMVLLLGMEGCPATAAATAFLAEYAASKAPDVVVYRVDVPPPGQAPAAPAGNVGSNLNYLVDHNRRLAARLDFFFYPTLYILDRAGTVRFNGACHPGEVPAMVAEIRSEAPGAAKKIFTPPLAEVGRVIPDFSIPDADNTPRSLGELCGANGALLFFSSTACPFSLEALADLERIKEDVQGKQFNFVIVSLEPNSQAVREAYAQKSPGTLVVFDADKAISLKHFGVAAVPFMYVLDRNRQVVARRPFVYATARAAVRQTLGMAPSSGAGRGAAGNVGAG
jgi:peroxiredoxin